MKNFIISMLALIGGWLISGVISSYVTRPIVEDVAKLRKQVQEKDADIERYRSTIQYQTENVRQCEAKLKDQRADVDRINKSLYDAGVIMRQQHAFIAELARK
jgi:septal ring factor EnvC (AmiA/AmiB activator)